MRKILCILAILLLFVPATALAANAETATAGPADPATLSDGMPLPDSVLPIVGNVADRLALAYATHDYTGLSSYLAAQEQLLLQAIGATDKNDVKTIAHVDLATQTAGAKVMIRPDCLEKKLEVDVKAGLNDEGQHQVSVKIKGDLTELQQAYVEAWVQKARYQFPGIVIKVQYL